MGLFNFLYRVILFFVFFRSFKIIRALKLFGIRPNFEVRLGAVAHLVLAQDHPLWKLMNPIVCSNNPAWTFFYAVDGKISRGLIELVF
jgi:hypothetical protein